MPDNTGTENKSVWVRVKDAWPIITFSVALAVSVASGYIDVRMAMAENVNGISNNGKSIDALKDAVANRASKFLTDTEIQRIWNDLQSQASDLADLERRVQELGITDERVNAKIELEIEKLRAEIQRAANEQQRALQEQTTVMQQILLEVQKD